MKVKELEDFLKTVTDKEVHIYFFHNDDNPFDLSSGIENAFEVKRDAKKKDQLKAYI